MLDNSPFNPKQSSNRQQKQHAIILKIVELMLPHYKKPNFNAFLDKKLEKQPSQIKFLVKLELKQRFERCNKIIDLRGRTKNQCVAYTIEKKQHWLDEESLNLFHLLRSQYGGYTFGVWQGIQEHASKTIIQTDINNFHGHIPSDAKGSFEAEPMLIGYNIKRSESRLCLKSQVDISLTSEPESIIGMTFDISEEGIKLKAPAAFNYQKDDTIEVTFSGAAETYFIKDIDTPILYKIVGVDKQRNTPMVSLRCIKLGTSDVPQKIIRYHLKTSQSLAKHTTEENVFQFRNKAYEHLYLKYTHTLPIFINSSGNSAVVINDDNMHLWEYWETKNKQNLLNKLIHSSDFQMALQHSNHQNQSYSLYCFQQDIEGEVTFFYYLRPHANLSEGITLQDSIADLSFHQFCAHGHTKPSWKVFDLCFSKLTPPERDIFKGSELEGEVLYSATLYNIADSTNASEYSVKIKGHGKDDEATLKNKFLSLSELMPSAHPLLNIRFDRQSRRKEHRYSLQTPIECTINDKTISGHTVNISPHGVALTLGTPFDSLKATDKVFLNFTRFSGNNTHCKLEQARYHVIRVSEDKHILQLALEQQSKYQPIASFFEQLIEHNKSKLIAHSEHPIQEASLLNLNELFLNKNTATPIFVDKIGNMLRPCVAGIRYPLPGYLQAFEMLGNGQRFSLKAIYRERSQRLLNAPMKPIENSIVEHHDIYISIPSEAKQRHPLEAIEIVQSLFIENNTSLKEKQSFIEEATDKGDFFAIRVNGIPVLTSVTEHFSQEINELKQQSPSHAKGILTEFNRLVGYGEIIDITNEVKERCSLHS
ncbi:PilZ domain-containing protein [Vibrio sp.]|nr:PilZ domain-containing protein [Vibrio sp.]